MGFDFNKLDSYKVALDDGLELNKEYWEKEDYRKLYLLKSNGFKKYRFALYGEEETIVRIIESDWEIFKKKVTDYFLNNN